MKNVNMLLSDNQAWISETFKKIDRKFQAVTLRSRDKLPYGIDENGIHRDMFENNRRSWWTNGFWGGMNWLLFSETKNEEYKKTAKRSEELLEKVAQDYVPLHHDVGFMWHLTTGADYRLTGDQQAKNRNLYMAASLASRFVMATDVPGGFIRAWNGKWHESSNYDWSIVDCLMNIPLLYWASEEIGDDRFKRVAMAHADMALRDHLRPDGSVNHIVEHDRATGALVKTYGGQGIAEGSSWSRGCAWALYGFALSYLHTKEERYLNGAKSVANYFIANCCDDWLPRVDFRAPAEPVLYDSTAGACAACGLIEIAKAVPENEGGTYMNAAINLLRAMGENFCNWDPEKDDFLDFGTERYPANLSEEGLKKAGVHIPIIYGDFFYVEAILKLLGNDFNPW